MLCASPSLAGDELDGGQVQSGLDNKNQISWSQLHSQQAHQVVDRPKKLEEILDFSQ